MDCPESMKHKKTQHSRRHRQAKRAIDTDHKALLDRYNNTKADLREKIDQTRQKSSKAFVGEHLALTLNAANYYPYKPGLHR